VFDVELADFERSEQAYIAHTPILKTRLYTGTAAASRSRISRRASSSSAGSTAR